jgi:ribonuclease J
MVATFASLISRIQQVCDAAGRHNRKVSIVGRSMVDNVKMAQAMGYLTLAPDQLVSLGEARNLPPNRVVLITTGSQGEPTSALVRIANQDHREVTIMEGDTVVISATPIPGNELLVSRTIDNLLRQKAKVVYDRIALVHVHGHASQEELKMMLSLTRPRYFVPVHGEYRHLMAHAQIAWDLGVGQDGIFVLEDGDVLELSEEGAAVVGRVSAGPIYLDGVSARDTHSLVFQERRALSKDGVVVVGLPARRDGKPGGRPQIVASGFMDPVETPPLFQRLADLLEQLLGQDLASAPMKEPTREKIRETAREFLSSQTSRRPMILLVTVDPP